MLDTAIPLPWVRTRIGADAILGLVPGIGDFAGLALSGYAVAEAWRMRAPRAVIAKMLRNLAVDFGVGLVPVAGDVFDIYWQANRRNLGVLEAWLGGEVQPRGRRAWPLGLLAVAALGLVLGLAGWLVK